MHDLMEEVYQHIVAQKDVSGFVADIFNKVRVDAESYSPMWHALGFVHCKLYENKNGALRMHVWPKGKRGGAEQRYKIHDHIFSLNSFVVCGEVTNRNYSLIESPSSENGALQLFQVEYHEDGSSLMPTNEYYKAMVREEDTTPESSCYNVVRGTFHESVVNENDLVVTLVATYDHVNDDPKMLGFPEENSAIFRKRDGFPKGEWSLLLGEISQQIFSMSECEA